MQPTGYAPYDTPRNTGKVPTGGGLRPPLPTSASLPASRDFDEEARPVGDQGKLPRSARAGEEEYRLWEEKRQFGSETFGFYQTWLNVPVWLAGIKVTVKQG